MGITAEVKGVTAGGKPVVVREMTVAEIRAWLGGKTGGEDVVDSFLFDELSLPDLCQMSTLGMADIDQLAPSEISQVIAEAKKVNEDFFEMRQRLVKIGQQVMTQPPPSAG